MPTRHLVLLRFAPSTTPAQQSDLLTAFADLAHQIPGITSLEIGHNTSPEGLNHSYTHLAQLTFTTPAARDAYLPHPAHQAFVTQLKPHLQDVLVFDYEI